MPGKRLTLTAEGWSLLEQVIPVWKAAMEELSHQMGSEQLSLTTNMMRSLAKPLLLYDAIRDNPYLRRDVPNRAMPGILRFNFFRRPFVKAGSMSLRSLRALCLTSFFHCGCPRWPRPFSRYFSHRTSLDA